MLCLFWTWNVEKVFDIINCRYQRVKRHTNVLDQYTKEIQAAGVVSESYIEQEQKKYAQILDDAFGEASKTTYVRNRDWLDSPWCVLPFLITLTVIP